MADPLQLRSYDDNICISLEERELREAVLGLIPTTVAFRLGTLHAERLGKQFPPDQLRRGPCLVAPRRDPRQSPYQTTHRPPHAPDVGRAADDPARSKGDASTFSLAIEGPALEVGLALPSGIPFLRGHLLRG